MLTVARRGVIYVRAFPAVKWQRRYASSQLQKSLELPEAHKVYAAHRLSVLAYMPADENPKASTTSCYKKSVHAWMTGADIDLGLHDDSSNNIGTYPKGSTCSGILYADEFDPVKAVCFGETDKDSFPHRVQWLAARRNSVLYIAFKGTGNAADASIDASVADVITPSGARYHSGFYAAIQPELPDLLRVINVIVPDTTNGVEEVVFCGHSLGGAYATVAALELAASPFWKPVLKPEAITFGSPLVVTSSAGHACIPSNLIGSPPRMTHFVANFDIVPRALALDDHDLTTLIKTAPKALAEDTRLVVSMGVNIFVSKAMDPAVVQQIVSQARVLLSRYIAVGTYVFCVREDGATTSTLLALPPTESSATSVNSAALQVLAECPDKFKDEEVARALVRRSVADHKLAVSYWPFVEAAALPYENEEASAWTAFRNDVAALKSSPGPVESVAQLWSAFTPAFLYSHALLPQALVETLSSSDRALLDRYREEAKQLTQVLTTARNAALGSSQVDFLNVFKGDNKDIQHVHSTANKTTPKKSSWGISLPWKGPSKAERNNQALAPIWEQFEDKQKKGFPVRSFQRQ